MRAFILCCCALLLIPGLALAGDTALDRPHWSLEIKGGSFYPEIENWKTYYGQDKTTEYAGTLAYKFLRQAEAGIELGYVRDRGLGYAPLNSQLLGTQVLSGSVKYELLPVNVFVLLRGVFAEEQWLVPYIGGGYTKMLYRESVEGQGTARGSVNGYHGRAGVQLLLDNIDSGAANNLYQDYGVYHTYLFVEVEMTRARLDSPSVDLGGKSYLAGFLFEF